MLRGVGLVIKDSCWLLVAGELTAQGTGLRAQGTGQLRVANSFTQRVSFNLSKSLRPFVFSSRLLAFTSLRLIFAYRL
jgi:hypothetical protein